MDGISYAKTKTRQRFRSVRLQMITTRAWLARVSAYAKRHHITRSEAIRWLVDLATASPRSARASKASASAKIGRRYCIASRNLVRS